MPVLVFMNKDTSSREQKDATMPDTLKRTLALVGLLGGIAGAALLVNLNAVPARAQATRAELMHLGDLMNESMQVHHTKLWLAGHAENWPLAAYELAKLKGTVEEIKEAIVEIQRGSAKWQSVPVGELLGSLDSHLDALNQAVKAKDAAKFAAGYRGLTAACNTCHARAGEPQIKIMEPTASGAFIDQDFAPAGAAK
jgi:hypothetical protein